MLQISKGFLESVGANDSISTNLLIGEFLDGNPENLSAEDNVTLTSLIANVNNFYQLNKIPFIWFASQNCSELIVAVGQHALKLGVIN